MKHLLRLIIFSFLLLVACSTQKNAIVSKSSGDQLSESERRLVDSILQYGLDNEALFTLLGNIKPMSSLTMYTFPIANTDSTKIISGDVLNREKHGIYLDRIRTIQQAVNKLNIPDLKFVMIPYLSSQKNRRIIQLSVIRISSLDKLLKDKENFYGQFGLVPGTDPVVVATAIEGNDKFARWRGYGYLFGYPDYAVDFYTYSSLEAEKTGKIVDRNFFRIPSYNSKYSNFAYAYPKDYKPTADVDSVLYYKAADIMKEYRNIRNNYLNADSTVRAYDLLKDYYKKQVKEKTSYGY